MERSRGTHTEARTRHAIPMKARVDRRLHTGRTRVDRIRRTRVDRRLHTGRTRVDRTRRTRVDRHLHTGRTRVDRIRRIRVDRRRHTARPRAAVTPLRIHQEAVADRLAAVAVAVGAPAAAADVLRTNRERT
jgi:hypothetical protein